MPKKIIEFPPGIKIHPKSATHPPQAEYSLLCGHLTISPTWVRLVAATVDLDGCFTIQLLIIFPVAAFSIQRPGKGGGAFLFLQMWIPGGFCFHGKLRLQAAFSVSVLKQGGLERSWFAFCGSPSTSPTEITALCTIRIWFSGACAVPEMGSFLLQKAER